MAWRRWIFLPFFFVSFSAAAFDFYIASPTPYVTLVVPHASSNGQYVLMRPDGKKYHAQRVETGVSWRHQDEHDIIVISQPMLGPWRLFSNISAPMPPVTLWRHLRLAPLRLPEVVYQGERLTFSPKWLTDDNSAIEKISPLQLQWQWDDSLPEPLEESQMRVNLSEGAHVGRWLLPAHFTSPAQSIRVLPPPIEIAVVRLSEPARFQLTFTATQPITARWDMQITTPFQTVVESHDWDNGNSEWELDVPISPSEGLYRWQGTLTAQLDGREVVLPLWDHSEIVLPFLPQSHATLGDAITRKTASNWQTFSWLFFGNLLIVSAVMAWRFKRRG